MNIDAYNLIIDTIKPLLDKHSFETIDTDNGSYFVGKGNAVRVSFDEEKQLFCLEKSTVGEDKAPENWQVISSWLFEAGAKTEEAKSIANDFEDTLKENLGIKPTVKKQGFQMPEKATPGETPGVKVLTGRFLTIFPQYKTQYDSFVTSGGTFLFVNFYENIAAPHLKSLLEQNDKKRLVKYFDMLNDIYCNGEKEVRAVISTCIIAKALGANKPLYDLALTYMAEMPYLKLCTENSVAVSGGKADKNA